MALITLAQVQQWLETTKLELDSFDIELEKTAANTVFGRLTQNYDTVTWVSSSTTPALVQSVIAMLVAAWTYNKAYSEEDPTGSAYAAWLEAKAMALLDAIESGSMVLPEAPLVSVGTNAPTFWPTDTGLEPDGTHTERVFAMGQAF